VLHGMGDIDIKPQAGVFFNYFATPAVFLTSSLRYGAGNDGKGLVVDLGAGHSSQLAPQWRMTLGAAVSLANADYMQAYFGVTPAQAASSGHPAYSAGAGARDARVNGALTYFLNQRLTFTGALSVGTLLGDAKDSPLTRKTSSPTGVFAMAYAF
jgi:outer membrane scaffolding protein for murein synthesis (MipA/OmpV family)